VEKKICKLRQESRRLRLNSVAEGGHGLIIQSVFRFRRIVGFYINTTWRVFPHNPAEVSPLRSFEVVFVCWVLLVDLGSDNNVWVVHINGK
jgi:hypothetical protein